MMYVVSSSVYHRVSVSEEDTKFPTKALGSNKMIMQIDLVAASASYRQLKVLPEAR